MLQQIYAINIDKLPRGPKSFFGSRRLHVITNTSDLDIYMHVSEINMFALKNMSILKDPSQYLNSTPKYGDVKGAFKVPITSNDQLLPRKADLLIFSDRRDIKIMDNALEILCNYSYLNLGIFQFKPLRIALFNCALQHFGFTPNLTNKPTCMVEAKALWPLMLNHYKDNHGSLSF